MRRRLSLLDTVGGGGDVFQTLDDNDSWSASLGGSSGGGYVKPQIERIGDNDEEWFSEAEYTNHSPKAAGGGSPTKQKRKGSGKGKKLLLPPEQKEDLFSPEPAQFKPPALSDIHQNKQKASELLHSKHSKSPSKQRAAAPEATASCLQIDFVKARAVPNGTSGAVPMDAFLSEFEATEAEEEKSSRDRKKKSSRDDPKRKQRRDERAARKLQEAGDYSESESDFEPVTTTSVAKKKRPGGVVRKSSILGELTDEDTMDVLGYSGTEKGAAAAAAPTPSAAGSVSRSASLRPQPQRTSSKKSSVRRSASEMPKQETAAPAPSSKSSSSSAKTKSATGTTTDKTEKKPIIRLAPAKKDYESDASRRRPKSRKPAPLTAEPPQTKNREMASDSSDDDSDIGPRGGIPAQYQVKNNNSLNNAKGRKSPEKRRQSMATTTPEDVVNAIRRRYSISSAAYNTDTDMDDQSVMTDNSESSRRSVSRRASRDVWREKEKFKQQVDNKFDNTALTDAEKAQSEKETLRKQMLDQSRHGPIRSLSRLSMHDVERSESTRMLGQLLGEPDDVETNKATDLEKSGRSRRQSVDMGYGQETVYGSIDQLDKQRNSAGSSYLPSGLNQVRRGSQTCDRRGSQTGGDTASESMRNLMQTLEGTTKQGLDSKQKSQRKKEKCNNSPEKTTKEQVGATSYDKSIDEILKARRLRGAKSRQKVGTDNKEETKKFNAMNLLTAGKLFK